MIRRTLGRVRASSVLWTAVCAFGLTSVTQRTTPPTTSDEFVGIAHPGRKVEFGSARSGRIARIHVKPGDLVEEGQLLFELDSEVERLEFARLSIEADGSADLELALARAAKARAEAQRTADLAERDIASKARELETQADLRIANAEVARARERSVVAAMRRDEAKARLDRLAGRSPFAGRVEAIEHEVGESIDALETIMTVLSLQTLRVEFPCPVSELPAWHEGTLAEVRTENGEHLAPATVMFASRSADVASQTALVRLELDNRTGGWLAGQKVWIRRMREASAPPPAGGK